jgi:AcrR family transcriptional regulator
MGRIGQRERLLQGMVQVANRDGYAGATVAAVIAEAGISRPTFYEHFADRDCCFVACLHDVHERLLAQVSRALAAAPAEHALASAIEALLRFVDEQPAMGRFLTAEAMGGGPQALDARDRGIAEIAAAIEQAHAGVAAQDAAPDLESRAVIGGVYRLLAARLHRGERWLARLSEDLLDWVARYRTPAGEHRWRTLQAARMIAPSPFVPAEPLHMPNAFPPGRPRLPEPEIAENHRLRILVAAALLAERKGYTATTVLDIVRLARVASAVFYRLFAGKQEAFMTAHALGFQQVMDVTASAFFAADQWPERTWEAGRALTQLLEKNPLVAHVGFVEAYAVGPRAVQRVEDSHTAFMVFLHEGFRHRPQETPPSRVALEAITTTSFEILYRQARASRRPEVAQLLPNISHLWLTPFLGPAEADQFIDGQLERPAVEDVPLPA